MRVRPAGAQQPAVGPVLFGTRPGQGGGVLDRILERLQARLNARGLIDAELFCADGTSIRASRAAAGASKRR